VQSPQLIPAQTQRKRSIAYVHVSCDEARDYEQFTRSSCAYVARSP
jgi:hypothetical protein